MTDRAPCVRCGRILHTGEGRVLISFTPEGVGMNYALRKSIGVCPRCIEQHAGSAVTCEVHTAEHARRESRRIKLIRAERRRKGACAICGTQSQKYRCNDCSRKRKLNDLGLSAACPGRGHAQD